MGITINSVEEVFRDFDIHQQLTKYQNLFLSFGGHKQACGLSIKKDNLEQFIKYLSQEEKIN